MGKINLFGLVDLDLGSSKQVTALIISATLWIFLINNIVGFFNIINGGIKWAIYTLLVWITYRSLRTTKRFRGK